MSLKTEKIDLLIEMNKEMQIDMQKMQIDMQKMQIEIQELKKEIRLISLETNKMTKHIDFINGIYERLKNSYLFKPLFN
jgi:hypothetical protein